MPVWLQGIDHFVLALLAPLAAAILISSLDDLVVDFAWACAWLKAELRPEARLFPPGARQLDSAPQHRIAILVPLWNEHEVIARMLEHTLGTIRYSDYHIFAGAYPNDGRTQSAVRSVAERVPNVHLVLCPHDGPTSKADCLNWIYQHLAFYEEQRGERFGVVLIHDAEDLIHPDELRWVNFYAARYDFIQTPVLALPTPFTAFTHGVYCDEFAEYHSRDMVVRPLLGGFLPSSGVGTAYRREALDRLARAASNRLFEPDALTEDYENGLRLHRLGCSQAFVPISRVGGRENVLATREYFPQTWRSALRQRTRWITGIALQSWERHGWGGTPGEVYWLWRDRKGLLANPLSVVANVIFLYGVATALWTRVPAGAAHLAIVTMVLQALRIVVRMWCVARIYGLGFALGVPLRAIYANALNCAATVLAVGRYAAARAQGQPLKWLKTEHAYPSRAALLVHRRKLGEILVGSGYVSASELKAALVTQTSGVRLGEHLVGTGSINEDAVYEALSLQQGLPLGPRDPHQISRRVAQAIPERVVRRWRVLPFRVTDGGVDVASPEVPSEEMSAALRAFLVLEVRFHLVTPTMFQRLTETLL